MAVSESVDRGLRRDVQVIQTPLFLQTFVESRSLVHWGLLYCCETNLIAPNILSHFSLGTVCGNSPPG
jgi:hypothetical protein